MKKVKKMIAVALCSLMMYPAFAAHNAECQRKKPNAFEVGMYRVKDTLKMRLLMAKKVGERLTLRLLDQRGLVLHQEVVGKRQRKYSRDFDFSQIKDGRYMLEITNGSEMVRKSVDLSTVDLVETPARTLIARN